jgi:two-component system sensor histidine kinase TctE
VQKGVDLALEAEGGDTTVQGQELLLHELLANLADNAIHYTPAGGSVLLRVRRLQDSVLLEVQDSGPGIDAAEYDKVFMPFYRAQVALETNPGGTGLGLAIVRDIARLHGATVSMGPPDSGSGGLKVSVSFAAGPCAVSNEPAQAGAYMAGTS